MDQNKMALDNILGQLAGEVNLACKLHEPMNSWHEAYAVILEELEEFWEEVKKKKPDPQRIEEELRQVAAMAVRAQLDLLPI